MASVPPLPDIRQLGRCRIRIAAETVPVLGYALCFNDRFVLPHGWHRRGMLLRTSRGSFSGFKHPQAAWQTWTYSDTQTSPRHPSSGAAAAKTKRGVRLPWDIAALMRPRVPG